MTQRLRIVLTLGLALGLAPLLFAGTSGIAGKKSNRQIPAKGSTAKGIPGQSSTLLPDGRILLLGGQGPDGPLATASMRDPQTGATVSLGTQLGQPRSWHTASLLPDGTVLVLGGIGSDGSVLDTAESFDPTTLILQTMPPAGLTPRAHHTATLLTNGLLLITGGISSKGDMSVSSQLWNFRTNTAADLPRGLVVSRQDQTATLLADGTVLLWGGTQANGMPISDGELFDPTSNTFRLQTSRSFRAGGVTPQVEVTIPENGAESVPVSTLISMRFSEALRVQTVNASSVTLASAAGPVSAKVFPAEGGMLAFVSPAIPLLAGTNYTVTITGAGDPSGTPLTSASFSFTTAGPATPGDAGILGTGQNPASDPTDSAFRKLPPLKAPAGVTAISGQVLLLNGMPLEGVTLRVGNTKTETDRTGRFLLRDISGNHAVMIIDGRSASEKHITYGIFEDGVNIDQGQTNILKYTIWMPEIDVANAVTLSVPTAKEVVVRTPKIAGLEFHIPAGTTITDLDGNVVDHVSITPVPVSQPPFPLPPGVNTPVYFTVQPGGGYLTVNNIGEPKGGWLVYPNSFHEPAGSRFNFWEYDPDVKGWYVYGQGSISQDAKKLIPDPGVVFYELTGAMGDPNKAAPGSGPNVNGRSSPDPVDLGTGLFVYKKTDLFLPDVIPINLVRTYRPNDAAWRAFGTGSTHSYDIFLVGDTFPYTYWDLVVPDGGRIHCPRISPGTSFADAVYQCSSSPGPFFSAVIIWNGNGWTFTRRDGVVYKFPDAFGGTRQQQGALLSITDRNGNTLSINRDSNSNITQITSPNGRWVQFTYDANFRITQAQDNIGRTLQYLYDTGGRLTQVTDVNSGIWKYSYDSNNNMTSLSDPRLITYLQNQYDSQNRVIKQTLADGVSTYQFSYNPNPCTTNCSGIWETDTTDPNGNVEKVMFNPAPTFVNGFVTGGTIATLTEAAGTSVAQTYTYQYQAGTNLLTNVIDPLNRQSAYLYDTLGNMTSISRLVGTPNSITTSLNYEAKFSHLTSIVDPLSHTTSFVYDSNGNLLSVTDALGNTSNLVYNARGQVVSFADPLGETSTFTYDGGDLAGVSDPLGRTVNYFTDTAGRTVSRTDSLGALTKYVYNALNQTTQIVDPNGGRTSFGFDPNGNLLSVTDPRNTSNPTTYTYDNFDRVATRKDPLGNQESYLYDGNNNLTQFVDRRGKVAIFTYDALNRRIFAGFGKSGSSYESTIGYTLDSGNRLTQAVDSTGGTITRGYDGLNRLTSEVTAQGTINYTFDNSGRRSTLAVPGQATATYTFDDANRLTLISQGSSTVSFGYDNASRRVALTLPNGTTTGYSYDAASELTGLAYANGSTPIGNLTYGYDLAGHRVTVSGNYARTGMPLAVSTTAFNADNQLITWGTANLFYDANGNMTSDGTHGYTWDARNRLTMIDNASTASFKYDAFGRRSSKTISGIGTSFLYDGVDTVQEVIGGTNTANSLTGGTDEVFQRTDSAGARTFLTDASGSSMALTDPTGTIQTQYSYEPFGNTTSTGATTTNSFAYVGREVDTSGLYFYRARYYSPTLQRFLSEDPIGFTSGAVNLYAYVNNNPIAFRDPFGLKPRGPNPASPASPPPPPSAPTTPAPPSTPNPGPPPFDPSMFRPHAGPDACGYISGFNKGLQWWNFIGGAGDGLGFDTGMPAIGGPGGDANPIPWWTNPYSPGGIIDIDIHFLTQCEG